MARTFPDRGSPSPPIVLELGLILNPSVEFLLKSSCVHPVRCSWLLLLLLTPG